MAPKRGSKLPPDIYLPLWLRALDEEIGLWIKTNDPRNLSVALYEARRQSLNPALEDLMICTVAEDVIYIAKKATEVYDAS